MPPSTRELGSQAKMEHPSICLCMIVRDGAEFIEQCLVSVREHIAYWVICDTGSVDETRELVRRALESVPGELHEQAWVDFGHNRTELVRLARGQADYLLVIDQDDTFEVDPAGLDQLDRDAFVLRHVSQTTFDYRPCLMRGDREWRYAGRVHTQLVTHGASVGMLDGARIRVGSIGSVRSGRYARELAIQLEEHADNPSDARLVTNIAHTYRGLGDLDSAIEWYDRRVAMGGNNEEEIFFASTTASTAASMTKVAWRDGTKSSPGDLSSLSFPRVGGRAPINRPACPARRDPSDRLVVRHDLRHSRGDPPGSPSPLCTRR